MENVFNILWNIAIKIIDKAGDLWAFLSDDIAIKIPLKIPLLAPNGIDISLGFSPLHLVGTGILLLLGFRLVKSLIPFA